MKIAVNTRLLLKNKLEGIGIFSCATLSRITKAHPEIVIVGTAGPGSHPGNGDFEAGWKLAEELGVPILDEH